MGVSVSGAWITARIAPLAILAAVLALLAPSPNIAARSDQLLAVLVAVTALGIEPARLRRLHDRAVALLILSIVPLLALTALAWTLGRAFAQPTRDGILALGLSSSEVASVGMVALAAGDAVLALGVQTGVANHTAGVYGALMLITGAAATLPLRTHAQQSHISTT